MQCIAVSSSLSLFLLQLISVVCAAHQKKPTNMLLSDLLLIQLIQNFNNTWLIYQIHGFLPEGTAQINYRLLRWFMGGADPVCCVLVRYVFSYLFHLVTRSSLSATATEISAMIYEQFFFFFLNSNSLIAPVRENHV